MRNGFKSLERTLSKFFQKLLTNTARGDTIKEKSRGRKQKPSPHGHYKTLKRTFELGDKKWHPRTVQKTQHKKSETWVEKILDKHFDKWYT